MSGIFDKYLKMMNTTNSSTYSRSMPNTGKYVQTIDGTEVYVPYSKSRRSSSTSSASSGEGLGMLSRSGSTSDPAVIEEVEVKKIMKTAPNNRVNF